MPSLLTAELQKRGQKACIFCLNYLTVLAKGGEAI